MPKVVIGQNGSPTEVATMDDVDGGGVTVTVANITDATDAGKDVLLAADVEAIRTLLAALGNTGDQVLDGKLQLNHQLVLKSIVQTDANVLAFYFGTDDGVMDASIRASATTDNHGQLALGVRDGTNNVVNAITIDGDGKQVITLAGYKLLVGASGTDISSITAVGKQLIDSTNAAAARTAIGAGTSNLAIGTTSATAKAGDWKPASADLPAATAAAIGGVKMAAAMTDLTAAPTQADFNGLLAKLRASGVLVT
ncbi:head fiber protein [Serratia marcescens]|uniref:head fiber protein n=1 Tax=Serratia marcescens TaxID=615 RepID=UPI00124A7BCD|nr:head fiber protein [Serratia marcescens]KAB1581147.1 hypothetical protein F7687_07890 [Serratia marcescens]